MPHHDSEHGLRVQLATALRERDEARDALAAAEVDALERAAQVAKQSQEDCFCKDKSDEKLGGMPCAACMEAARIEGTLHGLAQRALASPAAAPAAERTEVRWEGRLAVPSETLQALRYAQPISFSERGMLEEAREMVDVLGQEHAADLVARIDAALSAPPSEPVAPAPSAAEKRIAELERVIELAYPFVAEGDENTTIDGLTQEQIVRHINKVMRAATPSTPGDGSAET